MNFDKTTRLAARGAKPLHNTSGQHAPRRQQRGFDRMPIGIPLRRKAPRPGSKGLSFCDFPGTPA
jgi:hypothetical protein